VHTALIWQSLLRNLKKFMDILNQLGGLVVGSVPTAILFILLIVAYGFLVRRPLEKTLAERRARTSGAVDQARAAISAAEAETGVYEDKIRAARSQVMAERDQAMKKLQAERDAALESARGAARERVSAARVEIEQASVDARKQIEEATPMLSEQILRAILPAGALYTEAVQ
jgi:F-type H+-transporting ATPase subunit b